MEQLTEMKKALGQLKPELERKYHVSSIGLFGSVVRVDFRPESDIDIIVDFNEKIGIEFVDLAEYIEITLQKKVDLVSRRGIKDKYFKEIESEIVYV